MIETSLWVFTVNGVVPEKVRFQDELVGRVLEDEETDLFFSRLFVVQFDAVKLSHMVDAEYGNQGVDFKFVAREGFGWTK